MRDGRNAAEKVYRADEDADDAAKKGARRGHLKGGNGGVGGDSDGRGVKGQSDGSGGKGARVQERKHAEEGDKDADRAGSMEGRERSREHERGKDSEGEARGAHCCVTPTGARRVAAPCTCQNHDFAS